MDIQKSFDITQKTSMSPIGTGKANIPLLSSEIHTDGALAAKDMVTMGSTPLLASDTLSSKPTMGTANSVSSPETLSVSYVNPHPEVIFSDMDLFPKQLVEVSPDGLTKTVSFIYDTDKRTNMDNLVLAGSWDRNTGRYSTSWKDSAVPMKPDPEVKGRWIAQLDLVNDGVNNFEWGVFADAPIGKNKWAIFEEGNLKVNMEGDKPVNSYAPTTYTTMGAVRDGESVNFKFWAPNAKECKVRLWGEDPDKPEFVPLTKDPKTGMWEAKAEGSWDRFKGKNYAFEMVTSDNKVQLKNDPYTRFLQGPQRGVEMIYLHPKTGQQIHQFYKDPSLQKEGLPFYHKMVRFEIDTQPDADAAYLVLMDDKGNKMDKEALLERLGEGQPELVKKFHEGKFTDYWLDNIDGQGRIKMTKQGTAWAAIMNNHEKLPGLHYQFEVYKKGPDGEMRLVGDLDNNGILDRGEAKKTHFNDPYCNRISEKFGWERHGVLRECNYVWQNCDVPRVKDKNKMVIYQMHIGSVFGSDKNVDRSTFEDVIKRLDYFKELGANTLEIMPTNPFEGNRDWGYKGTDYLAHAEQYGFVCENGEWVSGPEALKRFIDAAHGKGINVINDVVYNHWGGDFSNLWNVDGEKNPYFNWKDDPEVVPGKKGNNEGIRHTDWGPMPAYNKEPVRQFIFDHAMSQLDEYKYDGLRFDFTHPMHNQDWGGGTEGWHLLRKLNRMMYFFHPDVMSTAEEFPNTEIVTTPASSNGQGGAGFDSMWNTEFQHRLVHDNNNPSIMQQAVKGWKTDMDKFMHHMVHHPGFSHYLNSVTVISNHDEVGNADRTVNVATNHTYPEMVGQWERNLTRTAFGVGMLSPGVPIFFQGEESMADNKFSWGRPSTWDTGWEWLDVGKDWDWTRVTLNDAKIDRFEAMLAKPVEERRSSDEYKSLSETDKQVFDYIESLPVEDRTGAFKNITRKMHHKFCRDMINLKKSSPAFDGDAKVERVYTHNEDSVMAFRRKKDGDEFVVISSLNRNDLPHYNIPLDGGKYQLVFNSDVDYYGGGNYGSVIYMDGNQNSYFDIPKGGTLVYRKIY